jgi:hypothetical protein
VSSSITGTDVSEDVSSVCIGGGGESAAGSEGVVETGSFLDATNVSEQRLLLIQMNTYRAQDEHQVISAGYPNSATKPCMQQT